MNLGDDLHSRRPVHLEDKDVGIVTENVDGLGAVGHCLQHIATEGDVCLSMGDNTVELVDELVVVWKEVAARKLLSRLLFVAFSTWKGNVWGQPDFLGSSSSHLLVVLCARNLFIIPVEQDYFLGVRRVVVPKLVTRSPAVPAIGQMTWYSIWRTSTSTTSGASGVVTETPRPLTSIDLVALPQAATLIDQGWRDWTQLKLEDVGYFYAALLPRDQQSTEQHLNIINGLPLDCDCLLEQLHCFNLLYGCVEVTAYERSLLMKVENCVCSAHFRLPVHPECSLCRVPLGC